MPISCASTPSTAVRGSRRSLDERGIDGHCLRLLGAQAIVIDGYLDGVLRAGVEICPDRTARRADAIFTAESKFSLDTVTRMLLTRMIDEARRYHLIELKLHGFDDIAELDRAARPGEIAIVPSTPALLRFESAPVLMAGTAGIHAASSAG